MPNWKKVIVSGSDAVLSSLIVSGSAAIGTSSLGPFENTLTLGARDNGGEGGQLGFNASGGTYTSASFIDNWQNKARLLKGTNTASTGLIAQWDIHTTQMQLAGYTAASSFPGTATANLAVDSGGNVITVSTTGGTVFPYTGNAVITGSLTTTGIIYAQPNGGMYFQGGDDAALYDINVSNHMGIYGVQDSTIGSIKLGSGGGIISGKSGNIGIGTTNPTSASFQVNGNVWANSFTGSLQGTASWASNVVGGIGVTSVGTSGTVNGITLTGGTITTSGTITLGGTLSNIQSSQLATSSLMIGSTNIALGATASSLAGVTSITATSFTGSLQGTASYATNALSASYAQTSSYATYAANGGVTKILAGANVNLSPVSGLGDVTVTSFGTNLYNTATGSYGSFYDTGSILAASATTVYSMSLSTTDISNGVFVSSSNGDRTRVQFTNAGTYNIQFSSQFSNSDNSTQDTIVWIRKNGTDIPDSSGAVGVPPFKAGSNGQAIAAWNYYLSLSANDYIQLCWHVEQANVITLETIAAGTSPTHPRTAATILTATRVDTFLSNTGSFSGSFTGTLTGTSSYATNALSASYATTTAAVAGTTNYIPKFATATTLGNSQIFESGSNIGIGTTSPAEKLEVNGNALIKTSFIGTVAAFGDNYASFSHTSRAGIGNYSILSENNGTTYINAQTGQNIKFRIDNIDKAILDSNGNFGIATTTPNAKLDVNGNAIITGSLVVTTGMTGTLTGTASYATQALSASYAPSAATFPYTGSAIISGSLEITGSLFVQDFGKTNIDSSNRYLYDAGPVMPPGAPSVISVNWGSRTLVRSNGATSVDWGNHTLLRSNITTLDWSDKIAYDTSTSSSIKWDTRELWDGDPTTVGYNTASLDWNNRRALGAAADVSIDWAARRLYDHNAVTAIGWDGRVLATAGGKTALAWTSDYHLNSNLYQTDTKSVGLQESVSANLNNTDESYFGDIIEADGITSFIDGTVTDGMLVYLGSSNTWNPVDQNNTSATCMLGIAFNVSTGTGYVLLEGHLVISDSIYPYVQGPDFGLPVYIRDSTTAGEMSTTLPTTTGGNRVIRVLGHCYYNNQSYANQWMMKFRPSNDWVII